MRCLQKAIWELKYGNYNEYKKYVKAKARMEKLENKIMESTELPFKKNHDNEDI